MSLTAAIAIAAASAVCATWIARTAAIHFGILSYPNPIVPSHRKPVPYLGGIGVFAGVVAAGCMDAKTVISAAAYLVLGVIDDLWKLAPAPKFAAQAAIAGGAVALGCQHDFGAGFGNPVLSAFWILVMVNAWNFVDVCDGLAAGLAAVTLSCLALVCPYNALMAGAGAAACAGFLLFNLPPARIYLGDAGTHVIGFLVAAVSLSTPRSDLWRYSAQVMLATAIPVFELLFITAARISKGIPCWRGSPDHFALRLQSAGLTALAVDVIAWAAAAAFGGAALAMRSQADAGK